MDKIWDRKILQSRRSLAVVAGAKKPNDHAKKTSKHNTMIIEFLDHRFG